jgi:iron(III) transport system ATP-binding protein
VALARSIVTEPTVLLLDEPLSNLDAKMREQMRGELREVIKRVGITAVHITHDQAEAMAVADRIAVMHKGTIAQVGTAREIYRQPSSRFVAGFVGRANFVPARVADSNDERVTLKTDGGLDVVAPATGWAKAGDQVLLAMRPEDYRVISTGQPFPVNTWPARVLQMQFLGPTVEYLVQVMSHQFQISSTIDIPEDEVAGVSISPDHVVVLPLDADTQEARDGLPVLDGQPAPAHAHSAGSGR